MSHARPITTQKEWDSRHQREQQRQRRSEIISRMTLVFSVLAIITAFYFVTMVP
jgi:pilus assembly protein TadC